MNYIVHELTSILIVLGWFVVTAIGIIGSVALIKGVFYGNRISLGLSAISIILGFIYYGPELIMLWNGVFPEMMNLPLDQLPFPIGLWMGLNHFLLICLVVYSVQKIATKEDDDK